MTDLKNRTLYAALALLLAAGGYALLTVPVRLALAPHAHIIRWLFGAGFTFDPQRGYLFPALGLAITRNCSGAKMYASALVLLAFGFPGKVRRLFLYAGCALPGAVLASVARIAFSAPFCRMESAALIHTLISLTVHFGVLAALYAVMYIATRKKGGILNGISQ